MLKVIQAPKTSKDTRSTLVDLTDRLDDAKALTRALLMAAEGATGCDEVEIDAISRLAMKISEDIYRAKALVAQARETLQ